MTISNMAFVATTNNKAQKYKQNLPMIFSPPMLFPALGEDLDVGSPYTFCCRGKHARYSYALVWKEAFPSRVQDPL